MAYFSNGSEGDRWRASNCDVCAHCRDDDEGAMPCPIETAHLLYNYDQLDDDKKALRGVLNLLVPETKDGLGNEACALRTPRAPAAPAAAWADHRKEADEIADELEQEGLEVVVDGGGQEMYARVDNDGRRRIALYLERKR